MEINYCFWCWYINNTFCKYTVNTNGHKIEFFSLWNYIVILLCVRRHWNQPAWYSAYYTHFSPILKPLTQLRICIFIWKLAIRSSSYKVLIVFTDGTKWRNEIKHDMERWLRILARNDDTKPGAWKQAEAAWTWFWKMVIFSLKNNISWHLCAPKTTHLWARF